MARIESTDFMANFRFHVFHVGGPNFLKNDEKLGAGFQSVTLPEITIPAADYREGTSKYTKKFPGPPEISGDLSMLRGVTTRDTFFFDWAIATISGGEYRTDLLIAQYVRESLPVADPSEFTEIPAFASARQYNCYECIPVRVKPASDLDASSGEVAIAEMDVAIEYFTITLPV